MHNPWYTAVTTAITKISKLNSCTVYQCQVIYLPAPLKKISHLLSHKITIKLLMPFPSTKEFTNFLTEFIYTDSNQSLLPTLKTITSLHNQLNTLKMCCEKHIVIQKLRGSCFFFFACFKSVTNKRWINKISYACYKSERLTNITLLGQENALRTWKHLSVECIYLFNVLPRNPYTGAIQWI